MAIEDSPSDAQKAAAQNIKDSGMLFFAGNDGHVYAEFINIDAKTAESTVRKSLKEFGMKPRDMEMGVSGGMFGGFPMAMISDKNLDLEALKATGLIDQKTERGTNAAREKTRKESRSAGPYFCE